VRRSYSDEYTRITHSQCRRKEREFAMKLSSDFRGFLDADSPEAPNVSRRMCIHVLVQWRGRKFLYPRKCP
jgi:hypothetical protein